MLLISPEINIILLIDLLLCLFIIFSSKHTFNLIKNWDINKTTELQYSLEKKTYLISTIIKYFFIIKIILFPFFILLIDDLSIKIPGAMCAIGVFGTSIYGYPLLFTKVLTIFFFAFWLIINNLNIKKEDLPYTKKSYKLLLFIFIIFILEFLLEILFFYKIDPTKIVSCCGTLFNKNTSGFILNIFIQPNNTVFIFYLYSSFMVIIYFIKSKYFYSVFSLIFLIISLVSLVYFFSPYIYELPTHKCPFCLLQKDYYYVGYFLYFFLFIGCFSGIYYGLLNIFFKENLLILKRLSIVFILIYIFIATYFPLTYYLRNNTMLW